MTDTNADAQKTETEIEPAMRPATADDTTSAQAKKMPKEIGGPKGPEPTRYGDWEKNGRCSDF